MKKIKLIIALDDKNWLWKNNSLAWRIDQDMKHFRKSTIWDIKTKNIVIMWRKTWESIPDKFRPLPDRINCILSKSYSNNTDLDERGKLCYSLQLCLKRLEN